MRLHLREDAETDVRKRADRQRDVLERQFAQEVRVLVRTDAVVDAADFEHVQRASDVGGRAFLARMGHRQKSRLARATKDLGEFLRRIAALPGIQTHGDDAVLERLRLLEGLERVLLAQMAKKAQDQKRRDLQIPFAVLQGAVDAR